MLYTLKDLVDFCYEHKRNKGFRRHSYSQIAQQILWADEHNKLYRVDDDRGLCGVAVATIKYARKELYIHHIVAVRGGFALFVHYAFTKFPEFSITGLRGSKLTTFNKRLLWVMTSRNLKVPPRCLNRWQSMHQMPSMP